MRTCLSFIAAVAIIAATMPASAASYKLVHSFGTSKGGSRPAAGLINVGGILYGTTYDGGTKKKGTVFSLNPRTGAERTIYSFAGLPNDGASPHTTLIEFKGMLYGTTDAGGSSACSGGCGTVFAVHPNTGAEKVLYAFAGGAAGTDPVGGLIEAGGKLYGTTQLSGAGSCFAGCGAVFELNPKTSKLRVVHGFVGGADGSNPVAGLLKVGAMLYGTTLAGGTGACSESVFLGCGTVFSVDPKTDAETVIHSFQGPLSGGGDGADPGSALINVGGTLYGTTTNGGAGTCGCGVVYSLNIATGAEAVVYSFAGSSYPFAGLIDVGGKLYGTTSAGGGSGVGTVFAVNPANGAEVDLHAFKPDGTGRDPLASLLAVGATLYGTTFGGGTDNGTVFDYTPQGPAK